MAVALASVQPCFNLHGDDEKGLMESAVAGAEDAALHEEALHEEAPHEEWQPLWLSLQTRPWSTLAVIGIDAVPDVSRVAEILASVGNRDGKRSVRVVSALGATPPDVPGIVERLSDASRNGDLILVPCDPPGGSPAMLPILHATSGVVLVVRLGASRVASAKKTVDIVHRHRIFETVVIG
jgi:hypothetical protein